MLISKCCKKDIYINFLSQEAISYYMCSFCERACDTLNVGFDGTEFKYDAGSESKTQELVGQQ
jgi:hypothetical protein